MSFIWVPKCRIVSAPNIKPSLLLFWKLPVSFSPKLWDMNIKKRIRDVTDAYKIKEDENGCKIPLSPFSRRFFLPLLQQQFLGQILEPIPVRSKFLCVSDILSINALLKHLRRKCINETRVYELKGSKWYWKPAQ